MNVDVERGLRAKAGLVEETTQMGEEEKQAFSQMLDLLGNLGGYDPETFEQEKQAILNSGISFEDFSAILGENFADKFGPREIVNVSIEKLTDTAKIPKYAHDTDACADIFSDETITINPGETKCISTGLAFAIPEGYVIHVYPRSSIGAKTPLRLANSVGVIDTGYRGELKVIYTNTGIEPFNILQGDRIAQMSIDHSPMARFNLVNDVASIGEDRGGGIGSTGV